MHVIMTLDIDSCTLDNLGCVWIKNILALQYLQMYDQAGPENLVARGENEKWGPNITIIFC